jgi:preprotein translocase subunit SecA
MKRFGADKIKGMVQSLGLDEMEQVRSKLFTKQVESAQKKVEGNNYDMRKNLLDYDNIVSEQRKIIYEKRNEVLDSEDIHSVVTELIKNYIDELIEQHMAPEGYLTKDDLDSIMEVVNGRLLKKSKLHMDEIEGRNDKEVYRIIVDKVIADYEEKISLVPKEISEDFERHITLRVIDEAWVKHISDMDSLRDGIGLRGYAQSNPLQAYTEEGFNLFDQMQQGIDAKISTFLLKAEIHQNVERKQTIGEGNQIKENESKKKAPVKSKKIGRNELCYCGSGKKYKQCHGKK